MNEELELLYKALSTSIDLGSYEQFASGMQNPKNRAKLVNYIKSKNLGLDVSEYTLEKWSQGKPSQVGTKVEPSRNQAAKSDLDRFNEGFDVAQVEQLPVEPTPPNQAPVSMGVPKTGPLSLAEPQPTGKEKVLTGLEGVPISELYNRKKATEGQLSELEKRVQQSDEYFNEWSEKVNSLQQELTSLQPTVTSASSKYKAEFETEQKSLKEKEVALTALGEKHKAAKTPQEANVIANEYNKLLADYTLQAKQANEKLSKVAPSAVISRFNAIIRELDGLQNDPTVKERLNAVDQYNKVVDDYSKTITEVNNRGVNEPFKQFTLTSPQYREERRKILAQKQPAEARLQAIEQQLFSQEKEFNPLGEVTARANGFESYEEMRLATNAGLTEADLRQKPNPPSKDQTDAIVTFLGEHYQNIPQSDKVELERYLIELAGSNPDQFWRTVRLSTPDSPLVGVGKAALLGGMAGISNVIDKVNPEVKASTKARLLEDTYVNKLGKLKTELSNLEARISSDPNLGAEYAVFADALNVVSQLEEKKGRTPQEEQQLQDALTAISNLQTPEVKQYAATLAQYKTDYKNLSNVLTNFPEELARRALLDFKNKQQVIQPTDNVATKVAKQMQAIKGSAANTALRIGGTTLKTIAAMPDRLARAITGQEYTSTAERYFEETGKFIESAIFLPELPENMRPSIAQDLMGQTKIRGEAVLPGIATGLVQMGALVFGGQALGSAKLLNSSAAGLTAAGFVFEFNDMYESFLNEGLSSRAALGLASGISYVVARMELISPQGVGLSFFDQSVKGAVKELSKATTKDFVPAFAQGSLYMMKQLGLENLQEFSQDGAKTIGNFLINKAYGTNLEDSFETEQIAETALITTGTTFIFTLLTGKSQRRGEAYEAAKYLAEKPEQLEAELQRRVSSNRMTAEQARQVYNYVQDVKKTEDANKAKEAFDKKIEGYVQGKPVVEDYEGPTEISAEEFFAADYSVPSGVIVDLDGTKYEVTNNEKGVTLTVVELEEKTEQTPEGETVTSQQVNPTKQKLTVEEFNELYQAPQGDRVADEVKVGNVATYQGKEYRITDVTQDGVTLENYAGSARMTVPASQVQAFTVQPLSTYTYKGQQYSINQQQKTAIENIDQVEQEQLEKYQDDAARVKRIKKDFEQSRRQALGLAPTQVAVGDEMFLNGRPVKVLGKRGSKVTVDMEGAQMSVEQADLSLSDNTELQQSQEALKEKVKGPQKGHVFKVKTGQMSKDDTKAYMKVNRVVADQINRAKKYTQVLPDMEVEVYESVEQARQAAIDAGAPESVVRGMNVGGRDISYFEEVNDTESEVTYLDGTKELVPTADIRENTFGGFWDGKNRIIINATHATNTTVAHEILHPVIESILKNKPEVVQRFFDQLKNEPDYQSIRSFVEQYDTATQPIEALVEFVARVATPEFNFKKRKASFKRKVVDFFKRLFGMVDTVNINTDNVLDFAQGLADYLQKGRAINIEQERSEGRFQLLAPNGKPSNLTPEQYRQVRTPEFRAWFGDWLNDPENASKVVDENGEPLVVYHGSRSVDKFNRFEGSAQFFSSDRETAELFNQQASHLLLIDGESYEIDLQTAYNIKDLIEPYEDVTWAEGWNLTEADGFVEKFNDALSNGFVQIGVDEVNPSYVELIPSENSVFEVFLNIRNPKIKNYKGRTWGESDTIIEKDLDWSRDGFIAENIVEGGLGAEGFKAQTTFVTFKPTQIKSAISNVGTFDATNPDIRFQRTSAGDMDFLGPQGQKNFKKWAGDRPVLSGPDIQDLNTGEPAVLKVYHGTTNEFYEFDSSVKGNIEGHLGKINYFTSDYQDAAQNYQTGGPDLTARVENLKERIEQDLEDYLTVYDDREEGIRDFASDYFRDFDNSSLDYGMTNEEVAERIASSLLVGGEDRVLEVFVKLDKPVVIGKPNSYLSLYERSEFEDYLEDAAQEIADENDISIEEAKEDYSWDVDMRAAELAGVDNRLHDALSKAISDNTYDWERAPGKASEILSDFYEEDVNLNQLERRIREELSESQNEQGELSSSQIVADFFKNLGFDGIVLADVNRRFPNMGLGSAASHVHVFDEYANQIKLADGSNVEFGPSKDIRFQRTGFHGTPHRFPKEILVQKPDGTQEYLVGTPDEFPVVPANYEVIREFPNGRFRMDKMGTGEGAQAYGWGMYFTDLESIARHYADKLSKYVIQIGDERFSVYGLQVETNWRSWIDGDIERIIELYLNRGKDALKGIWGEEKGREVLKYLSKNNAKIFKERHLYKVSLHKGKTPEQYTWLEWDEKVRNVEPVKNLFDTFTNLADYKRASDMSRKYTDEFIQDATGEQIYNEFVALASEFRFKLPKEYHLQEPAKIASLFLLEAGIDGIRFPAESKPRDKARGFNYVVFDENAIEIEQVTRFQRTNTLQQAIANGTVTFTDAKGNPCARGGFKQKKVTRGGTWQIIKEFKGKTHEQGGIDVEIKDGQISMTRGETKLEAKYGLLI